MAYHQTEGLPLAMNGDGTPRNDGPFTSPVRPKQSSKYELLSSSKKASGRFNKYVVACALLASLNSSLLGYDVGVMSGAVLFIKEDLGIHELQEEVLIGSLNLISLVGGIIAGRLSDSLGRRKTMAIASLIFLIGAAVMGLAPGFSILLVGRLIAGIGVGFGLMIAPVYTAELSPASSRGALVSLPEIFINFGILLGYVASYALSGLPARINWRLMLGLGTAPAIVLAMGVLFMPESPRWLVLQGRIEEAERILIKTSGDKEEADLRLVDIMIAAGLSPSNHSNIQEGLDHAAVTNTGSISIGDLERSDSKPIQKKRHGENVWRELLCPNSAVRRMLIVALGIQFFQQSSGIDALVYYSPSVFNEAGISSKAGLLGATVAVGFAKTAFILVATRWLDRIGRRPLLLISSLGMTASLATLASGFLFLDVKSTRDSDELPIQVRVEHSTGIAAILAILAICSFVSFFSIGMGPVCWVLTSEIFPLKLRAQAMSLGIVVNRLASSTVAFTFLSISDAITPAGTFFLFAGIAAVSVVFIYCIIPETKGKTLEEIVSFFSKEPEKHPISPLIEMGEASFRETLDGTRGEADDVKLLQENADLHLLTSGHGGELTFLKHGSSKEKLLAKVKLIAKQQSTLDSKIGKL
ncbi:hypothetical protein O6H91_04G054300 [Diphasiastrum complanatum]|uniref:Uncharacterized protein n=1 Tax=Diphasiastrum complanatum TaxID=34168 RepID=A0ACC2DWY9_DIPCM|nr:hypothetical protein O6H91_04G054300 [Diphasiastrum complanatum]